MEFETVLEKCISSLEIHQFKTKQVGLALVQYSPSTQYYLMQVEVIKSFVLGKDTFVILTTGYGESIIYGVLPLVFDYVSGE